MKNNTKKNYTKKLRNKKGGTKEETVNKIQEKRNLKQKKKDKINKFLSKEDTKLINRKTREKIAPDSLLRVLTNYTDEQVDNLTEKDLYKAYIIWRKGEAKDRNMSRSLQRGKIPEDGTHHTRKRKRKSIERNSISIEKEELAEAAKHAAEEQEKIDDMNTHGTQDYPMPRSPTQNMIIADYPPDFTPHGHTKKRESNTAPIMIPPQELFSVKQEISEEPDDDIYSLFDSSDMTPPDKKRQRKNSSI
tara:strand:+ start:768 stop:1508 length:741 start_codon:yes stop_codon:yes gene_type:complete